MNSESKYISESITYVKSIFDSKYEKELQYHNWAHTKQVKNAVTEIANSEPSLTEKDKENLQLGALFHDVAYFEGRENHEVKSAKIARDFLHKQGMEEEQLQQVERIILATKLGTEPTNLIEKIIQDADLSNLGSEFYERASFKNLFNEINNNCEEKMKEEKWCQMSIEFMKKHKYKTQYALSYFKPQKLKNIAKLISMTDNNNSNPEESIKLTEPEKKKKKGKKKKKTEKPEKGIETMFRVSLRNHMNLSILADNKANTLISVNAIIISIVLSTLFPKMDNNTFLIYPSLALVGFCIATIILAILSTIPKTTHGLLTKAEVNAKKGNLIFFGNFHKMSLEDYEWGIEELMNDKEYLYKSLTRDLYFLGKVLNTKYTLLRYSYFIFVFGLLVSIVLFTKSILDLMVQAQ